MSRYRNRLAPALRGAWAAGLVICALLPCAPARAIPPSRGNPTAHTWDDPLLPMLRRTDHYLQQHAVNGVTMDWRYDVSPSEEIRQTVVCQLLAYVELARLDARPRLRTEIVRHADFLLGRLEEIRSHTPFDGMLAYSLLGAYEITHAGRFLDGGAVVTAELLGIPTAECILNGGLMVAMGTGEYARLTGSPEAEQKTRDIVAQLEPYQNADGSFPHWCWGSRDIHYTGWMGMELMHLRRLVTKANIDSYLTRMTEFLAGRIGPDGRAIYQEPCPDDSTCTQYYYSRATGCPQDLDSRGWTVEPAYCALMFDHLGAAQYQPVMTFLDSIETGGTVPDLYGYWPPPDDPEYPWTTADTSAICTSINFWVLSTIVADRIDRGVRVTLVLDDLSDGSPPPGPVDRPLVVAPNPAPGGCMLRFSSSAERRGSLDIYDAGGRRVRRLAAGRFAAGPGNWSWDGRDDAGRMAPLGVYFARLQWAEAAQTRRFTLLR